MNAKRERERPNIHIYIYYIYRYFTIEEMADWIDPRKQFDNEINLRYDSTCVDTYIFFIHIWSKPTLLHHRVDWIKCGELINSNRLRLI